MTLVQSLPKNGDGEIVIPVGSIDTEGNKYPGLTSELFINNAFPVYSVKTVPLSEADYQALLESSTHNWKLNWQEFRADNFI